MSYAGHVFDMIRRNKENREHLKLRRERTKEKQDKYAKNIAPPAYSDIAIETAEEQLRGTYERKISERQYFLRFVIWCMSALLIVLLIFFFVFK